MLYLKGYLEIYAYIQFVTSTKALIICLSLHVINFLNTLMQVLNLTFLIGVTSFILNNPCDWFKMLPAAFGFLRNTCSNTMLALLHISARNTQPWVDSDGKPLLYCSHPSLNRQLNQFRFELCFAL